MADAVLRPEMPNDPSSDDTAVWLWLVKAFDILGHLANFVGVGVHIASSFLPIIVTVLLGPVAAVADPLIYCFRGGERIIRLIGRNKKYLLGEDYSNVIFKEEIHGLHPAQNKADIAVTLIFILAIVSFALPMIPFHLSLAWFLGLTGVSISGYFDHRHPENKAREHYEKTSDEAAFKTWVEKYYSTRLYYALLASLVLLLILGSAPGFGLPLAVDVALNVIAQVGSVLVISINIARFVNYCSPEFLHKVLPGPEKKAKQLSESAASDSALTNNAALTKALLSVPATVPSHIQEPAQRNFPSPTQNNKPPEEENRTGIRYYFSCLP